MEYNLFNAYLNSKAESSQGIVGFYDGYLREFIGTPVNRMPNSIQYARGAQIGGKIGSETMFWLYADKDKVIERVNPQSLVKRGKDYLEGISSR